VEPILTQGTVEYLWVDVTDELGVLTDLSAASPRCDVVRMSDNVKLVTAHAADNIDGMRVYFLIDTTTGSGLVTPVVPVNGWWSGGEYKMYTTFSVGAEVPRLGPLNFRVDAS
jgi:hypothetical protein